MRQSARVENNEVECSSKSELAALQLAHECQRLVRTTRWTNSESRSDPEDAFEESNLRANIRLLDLKLDRPRFIGRSGWVHTLNARARQVFVFPRGCDFMKSMARD